ncbi:MAG: hypothetical protein JKP95_01460 [Oceanicaulis sp.]|nr:hypothetical protein [Oceanicaulis sp.]
MLAAGLRDQAREFVFLDAEGQMQALTLPNLYQVETPGTPPDQRHRARRGARAALQ